MRDVWLKLVGSVLRPARGDLERCLQARGEHIAERRRLADRRASQLAQCRAHIEDARALVFTAKDGVVPAKMTDLEREWRRLARRDPDDGLMDLWARVAPASWLDRKRWRGNDPSAQLDTAVALAADVNGVEQAEAAVAALARALAEWGTPLGPRVHWRSFAREFEGTRHLLSEPLRIATEALAAKGAESVVLERAERLGREVHEAATLQLPTRPLLASDLAHAAFVDAVLRAAALGRPNPVASFCALWQTGYPLAAVDALSVTLELPPL